MGKKGKPDEAFTYEVWMSTVDRGWCQIEERGNGGVFDNRNRAMLIGESKFHDGNVVEVLVIERRAIATFNGEAISAKHLLKSVQQKKEIKDVDNVHGDRPEADNVPAPGPQLGSEAASG